MGDQVKAGALAGVAFGVFMGAFYALFADIRVALAVGVVGGAMFGVIIALVMAAVARKTAAHRPALAGERLIREGTANHFRNAEGRGGWLYLTDKTLYFRPHRMNIQGQQVAITLADVTDVQPSRTLGLVPNGLTVAVAGGARERFAVQHRSAWAADIRRARQALPAG